LYAVRAFKALVGLISAEGASVADFRGIEAVWERGCMPDDREDRRQKDRRDLEFYRQRVRPSATDLWRTLERPRGNSEAILAKRAPGGRSDGRLGLTTPASIAEVQEESRPRGWPSFEPGGPVSDRTEADAIWPLVCTVIVLVVTALTDSVGRVATVLPF
jgi:hypothetical protein